MRNFGNLCIMVWIHMDAHEYVFVFRKIEYFMIFSDRFFDPVFFRFRYLGLTGSMTGPVLVTLVRFVQLAFGLSAYSTVVRCFLSSGCLSCSTVQLCDVLSLLSY
jgi:hypothetical protein